MKAGKAKMAAMALALLALAGCSKLTRENYSQVEMGMEYGEVKELLGEPSRCKEALGMKGCVWEDGESSAQVNFVGDAVVLYSSKNLK